MQVYVAKSILSSTTFWVNAATFFVMVIDITEVRDLIPSSWMPTVAALVAVANVGLRFKAVRPVALIAQGDTKAVEVKSLAMPPPTIEAPKP